MLLPHNYHTHTVRCGHASGADHEFDQVHFRAELSVNHPADAHGDREQAGPRQVAHGFGKPEGGFRKRGGPLGHGQFGSPGADHQQDGDPENRQLHQAPDRQPLALLRQPLDGAGGEVVNVIQRNQGPDAGQPFPVLNAEHGEKQRGQQDDADGSPAVEGVQQAHDRILVVKGAGLHDGAGQHLDQAAADGIEDDADHDADKRVGEAFRQEGQARQPEAGGDL